MSRKKDVKDPPKIEGLWLLHQGRRWHLSISQTTLEQRLVTPYATDFFATTMRVSNARAIRELGWKPAAALTYHEGIQRAIQALGQEVIASS